MVYFIFGIFRLWYIFILSLKYFVLLLFDIFCLWYIFLEIVYNNFFNHDTVISVTIVEKRLPRRHKRGGRGEILVSHNKPDY